MASAPSKLYSDDVSLLVVLLDTNPFFWNGGTAAASSLSFSTFLTHVLSFLNSILLLNQLNQVVVIATGVNSCDYIYDSSSSSSSGNGKVPALCSKILLKLEEFLIKDENLSKEESPAGVVSSLLSGSLSLALCYVQRVFRSGLLHPQPRILCLQGSPDGPEQYVAVMNAIFSAQRSMVPIDSCVIGAQHSAFLQQASYITGGVYLKPQQLDGLFQYLCVLRNLSPALNFKLLIGRQNVGRSFFSFGTMLCMASTVAFAFITSHLEILKLCSYTVFATDLQSRSFLQLPKPVGVDFRASCFCHKKTIDMGYICSVCLSIFCKHHKKCSTCGSVFGQAHPDVTSSSDRKRKTPEA